MVCVWRCGVLYHSDDLQPRRRSAADGRCRWPAITTRHHPPPVTVLSAHSPAANAAPAVNQNHYRPSHPFRHHHASTGAYPPDSPEGHSSNHRRQQVILVAIRRSTTCRRDPPGMLTVILRPSGSGKSTLLPACINHTEHRRRRFYSNRPGGPLATVVKATSSFPG